MYYVTVTDKNGKQAADTCRVAVTGDAVTATFENLFLEKDGFWRGPDTKGVYATGTYYDKQLIGSFLSGSYSFENNYSLDYGSWQGFAYSNRTQTSFSTITPDQFNSVVGNGYDGSENYAVAYSTGVIKVLNKPVEGDIINGCYITNNAYAMNTITTGDSYAHKFGKDDYLKIVFTGHHADGTEDKVEYYLADYRAAKEADRYYLDTWQWADLRQLGKVTSVSYTIEGSDSGQFGLNTPAYFCMDNFNGDRVVTNATTQNTGGEIDLKSFFQFDDADATVTYAFADALSEELAQHVAITTDGKLDVAKNYYKPFSVVVSATQKGKIQFINIPFDIVNGIDSIDGDNGSGNVSARYNVGGQKLNHRQNGINIIRTTGGKTVKTVVK